MFNTLSSLAATIMSGKKDAMRTALVSLIALAAAAPLALAQTPTPPAAPAPAAAMAAPAPAPAAATAAPAPVPAAPPPAAPTAPAVAPPTAGLPTAPAAATPGAIAPATAAVAPPAEPAAPPPPPPAPTDPTAIALINTLETVCIPSANGGNLAQIAKSSGFRKTGDNFVRKGPGYQITVEANTYNPTQCHVDIVHPVDPAAPLIVALHNWAAGSRGWSLYKNNKFVQGSQEITVRSWEHSGDGKDEGLVFNTLRKADGTPSKGNADTSMMIYSTAKTPG